METVNQERYARESTLTPKNGKFQVMGSHAVHTLESSA